MTVSFSNWLSFSRAIKHENSLTNVTTNYSGYVFDYDFKLQGYFLSLTLKCTEMRQNPQNPQTLLQLREFHQLDAIQKGKLSSVNFSYFPKLHTISLTNVRRHGFEVYHIQKLNLEIFTIHCCEITIVVVDSQIEEFVLEEQNLDWIQCINSDVKFISTVSCSGSCKYLDNLINKQQITDVLVDEEAAPINLPRFPQIIKPLQANISTVREIVITCISDTHKKHAEITNDLPGGDIIIHAGDILRKPIGTMIGVKDFIRWFGSLNYKFKIFVAGNHDFAMEGQDEKIQKLVSEHEGMFYLRDQSVTLTVKTHQIKIYGTPFSPKRYKRHDAFDLADEELTINRANIPQDCQILVSHCPPFGVDSCELLEKVIKTHKPMIHACGHVHEAHGYDIYRNTHIFRGAVVDFPNYNYTQRPLTGLWDFDSNKIELLK